MIPNPDLVILKNLIAYYVQRQQLVVLALLNICPELLAWPENRSSILGIDIEPYIDAYGERIGQEPASIQSGTWKHDWRYWQHGIGCELTHLKTGEYFEWDAPDPDAFYIGWFSVHLDWRMKYEADDPYVKAYAQRKIPFEMICDLAIHKGLLHMKDDGMYKWVGD